MHMCIIGEYYKQADGAGITIEKSDIANFISAGRYLHTSPTKWIFWMWTEFIYNYGSCVVCVCVCVYICVPSGACGIHSCFVEAAL